MAVTALRTGSGEMANIGLEPLPGLHAGGDHSLKAVGSTDKSIPCIIAARKGLNLVDRSQRARFGVGRPDSLYHSMSLLVPGDAGHAGFCRDLGADGAAPGAGSGPDAGPG